MAFVDERGLSPRIASLGVSATGATAARAKAMRAAGIDIINFAAGELDLATPKVVVEAAVKAARDPLMHHYTPAGGLLELRETVARRVRCATGTEPPGADQVLICAGTKHAVFNAIAALVGPGDEVLLPTPYWVSYPSMVHLAGGTVREIPTTASSSFRITIEQLEEAWTPATKLLVFVSPSNPSGSVYTAAEVEAIARWAIERDVWVLSDDIYEDFVYDGIAPVTMPEVVPESGDRVISAGGVGKTYAMTGWRVGWLTGRRDVIEAATALQSHSVSHASNVAQAAALAALTNAGGEVAEFRRILDRRRRRMCHGLDTLPGVEYARPQGAFYVFPRFPFDDGIELAGYLLDEARVAVVPGEAFGAPGHARLSYALDDDALERGLERIGEALARASR